MNGNKKIAKKIVAGSMAVIMAAGLAGTYEYHESAVQVQAAEQKNKDTQELKETAENVLADHTTDSEDTGFSKEESVYVKADASGNVKKTTVSEWLKNPEKGTISDTSELKNIKNVKGDETFETGSNNSVNWKSEGNDIYYQGTTDKEIPVDVKVSYKLDGKSISPEDLKGKSGKVEIQFSYDNKSKQTVNVNGEDVEMYTPFTMVSAMMLSTDEYSNVSVENGKLISDGDKNIVVGVAFPGLADDLNLKDLDMDIDIPETVTITADVKDATVGTSITMASAELMNEFGLDDIDSFDDLQDSIDDLEDATNQLVDGSKEAADGSKDLADGAGTLNDGTKSLADGAGTLKDGIGTLKDGAGTVNDGAGTLASGAGTLASGAETLADGAGTLASGAGSLATGVNTLNEKSGTLVEGVNSLATGVGEYTGGVEELYNGSTSLAAGAKNVSDGAATLNSKVEEAATGAGKLSAGVGTLQTGLETAAGILNKATNVLGGISAQKILDSVTVDTSKVSAEVAKPSDSQIAAIAAGTGLSEEDQAKVVAAIKEALGECSASVDTSSISKQLNSKDILTAAGTASAYMNGVSGSLTSGDLANGATELKAGADSLTGALGKGDGTTMTIGSGMANLADGAKSVSDGAASIQKGATKLHENSAPLMAGVTSLKDGGTQLAGGVSQLADGAKQVSDGANSLASGSKTLSDGANSLASGSQTLAVGTKSLYDGTGTLYDGSNTLSDGANTLANGTQTLLDGANALADGNQTLADGMQEYKEEAIDKLTDLFNGDISSVTDRIDAMSNLAKEYKSFAGISDGVSGTTKFIIETEGIDD